MNLQRLQIFVTLSEELSFTKTASVLGLAQSGVTTHTRLLEEELGVKLFERIGKRVTLTFEGERLLPYAKQMLALSREMRQAGRQGKRLTVGVSESIANYLFGDMLKEYLALYPDDEIFLKILDGQDYVQMLADGEIDLAAVLDMPVKDKSLRVMQKRKEKIILAASSTHELSGKSRILAEDFKTYATLLPAPDCPYRRQFEQKLLSEGVRPKTALETDSVSVIKESALTGIGIGLLPEFAVRKELIYHMLENINYKTDFPIYAQLLMHQDKWVSAQLEHFLEIAGRHLSCFPPRL